MKVRKKVVQLLLIVILTISLITTDVRAEPVTIIIGGIAFTAYEIGVIACTLGVAGYALVNGDDIQRAAMDFMTGVNHDTLVAIKGALDDAKDGVINLTTDVWSTVENFVQNPRQALWGVSFDPNLAVDFESAYVNFSHSSPVGYKSVSIDGKVLHFVEKGDGTYYLYMDGLKPSLRITLFDKNVVFDDYIIYGDFASHISLSFEGEPMFYWVYDYTNNSISLYINRVGELRDKNVFQGSLFENVPVTDIKPCEYQHHTIDVTGEDWYKTLTEGTVITAPTTFDGYTDLVGGVDNVDENIGHTYQDNPANVDSGTGTNTGTDVVDLTGELDKFFEKFTTNDLDITSLYNAILERFNYNIFSDTLRKLERLKTAPKTPPKITINLHEIFGAIKNLGDFDNTLEDKETVFIDFAILEELQFQGMSVIEWFRVLINIGMMINTFFHIKHTVMPQKAMKG